LLTYNSEDCAAAEKVANAVAVVCRPVPLDRAKYSAVNADSLKREYPQRFGDVEFVPPEFQEINKAAYWDYQRDKVYVRSNSQLRRLSRKKANGHSLGARPSNQLRGHIL
jgi:hypothetical protein